MAIRQITIIGTGLIGGSFALALRKRGFAGRIVGCDRQPALKRAKMRGVIDAGFVEPVEAVRGSQLVVLATPVLAIVDLIGRLAPGLPPNTLLTDVGSTKAAVAERALNVFGKNAGKRFLAGHPMAGKEHSGVDYADADLFQNAMWFLTPLPGQNLHEGKFAEFAGWIGKIGAHIAMLPPGGSRPAVRVDQPSAADDFDGAGGGPGGGVWRRGAVAFGGRAGAARDDADFGESVFDVAGYRDQQQEKSGGCAVQGGAAAGAHPGESGDAGARGRI